MKKTIHIHLGGMPFVIDEDAFNTLSSYLQKLKDKFTNELEQKEILEDIETRIAEVFSSKMNKGKQVVELTDVLAVIDQLGKPEEIDEPSSESSFTSEPNFESKSEKQFTTNGSKKLFRDEENKIFGGVIIGLCHYFGIAEPLWARLAFVFLLWLSFGTVMLGYFILWLLIPAAKTYADKLQMKGEPVTLDTIEKEVKSAFLKVDEQFGGGAKGVESFLVKIVSVVKLLLKGVLKIVAAIVLFISFFFLMAYLSMLSGFSVLGTGHLQDYLHLFVDSKTTYWLAAIMTLFAFGIPLFWVMYSAASFLFSLKLKLPKSIMLASLVLWLCSIVGVGTIKMKVFSNFATKNHATEEVAILQPTSNTLYLLPKEDTSLYVEKVHISIDEDDMEFDLSNALLEKTENGFLVGNAMVDIQPSKDEKFHLTKTISAKGNSRANAKKILSSIIHTPHQQIDSLIKLQGLVEISKKAPFRMQAIGYTIYVPLNKKVKISNHIFELKGSLGDGSPQLGQTLLSFENIAGKIVSLNIENADIETLEWNDKEEESGQDETKQDSIAQKPIKSNKVRVKITNNGIEVKSK